MSVVTPDFDEEVITDCPEGWTNCLMRDVSSIVGGGTPKTTESDNFSDNGHAWLTPADLSKYEGMYIQRGKRCLTEKGLRGSSAVLLPKGAVLFSSRAPIGYTTIAANEISTNQGFRSFVCKQGIVSEYVYFYLKFAKPIAERLASGTTFLEISGTNAGKMPFLLAPFPEQKRIAAKLIILEESVQRSTRLLRSVPQILKRFRQSVLAAACSGRLTADWRDSLPVGVEDWKDCTLGDLLREPLRNGHSARASTTASGVRTLTLSAVTYGDFSERNTKITIADPRKVADLWLRSGDILIERSNTPELVGTTRMYAGPPNFAIFPDLLIRVRTNNTVLPAFAELSLQTHSARSYFMDRAQGSSGTMPKIDQGVILEFPISVPSLQEQHEIVRRVDALFKLADTIKKRVAAAQARADKLTQSILAKAFRGELVPTEAELARQEGREYEPASVLLERIRTERLNCHAEKSKSRRGRLNCERA